METHVEHWAQDPEDTEVDSSLGCMDDNSGIVGFRMGKYAVDSCEVAGAGFHAGVGAEADPAEVTYWSPACMAGQGLRQRGPEALWARPENVACPVLVVG